MSIEEGRRIANAFLFSINPERYTEGKDLIKYIYDYSCINDEKIIDGH